MRNTLLHVGVQECQDFISLPPPHSRTGSSVTVEPLPQSCSARDEILSLEAPLDTLDKVWSFAVRRGGRRECLGTRECFAEEPETQPDGKVFVKLVQGEYKYKN